MKNRFILFVALMSIAASATFTACQKDEQTETFSFSATMEDCTDREDKTTLINNRLFWESGDEVMIYGSSTSGVFTAVPNAYNATQAEFVGSTNLGSAPYYAVYPASIATGYNSVNLPTVQVSPDGSPKGLPMYEQTNGRNLHFHNLCGLLRLHLTKPDVSISSVTFVAEEGTTVSGGFSVAYSDGSPHLTPTNGCNWVRLQCTTPQSIATGGDFYLYLPEGNYQNFRIEIRTSDGQICTKTSNAPKTLVIERSYCTTITLGSSHLTFVPDFAAELVDGPTFNAAIPANATAVVFEYNSPVCSGTLLSTSDSPYPIYGNLEGTVWKVTTFVSKMNANPDCSNMFSGTIDENLHEYVSNLVSIDFGDGFNTSNVTDMSQMFCECRSLTSLDVSHFNTINVTAMEYMFGMCENLTSLDVSHFSTTNVTNMSYMFTSCTALTALDVSTFNTSNVTDMSGMFSGLTSITTLDLSSFNTANVTNMASMFHVCLSLTSLDVSNFNTSNVTDMWAMFWQCVSLTDLDVFHFNTSNVTDMSGMFYMCQELSSLDLSNFNTSNVTNMIMMFSGCRSLTSLNVSNFNTSNVTDMWEMFGYCSSLTSLDVSNFNTLNVTRMGQMFMNCSSLTSIDLSNFNTSNVANMVNMFRDCSGIVNLNLSNFDMSHLGYTEGEGGLTYIGKEGMCDILYTTSSNCTIICPLDVENAIKEVDPYYDPSNPVWPHAYYYYSGLPTSGVTFTWVRP